MIKKMTKLEKVSCMNFNNFSRRENTIFEGYFIWKVIKYDEKNQLSKKHYEKKINQIAKEYVRGTYSPSKKEYVLKGYKKDDPHNIIGIDTYHLKCNQNGDLGGTTNANGSWLGRINGKQMDMEVL